MCGDKMNKNYIDILFDPESKENFAIYNTIDMIFDMKSKEKIIDCSTSNLFYFTNTYVFYELFLNTYCSAKSILYAKKLNALNLHLFTELDTLLMEINEKIQCNFTIDFSVNHIINLYIKDLNNSIQSKCNINLYSMLYGEMKENNLYVLHSVWEDISFYEKLNNNLYLSNEITSHIFNYATKIYSSLNMKDLIKETQIKHWDNLLLNKTLLSSQIEENIIRHRLYQDMKDELYQDIKNNTLQELYYIEMR